ncbi:striatin-related protein [Moniliophthora roreri]|nr:striatin-related protein [Moniliophthora roreri]
MLFFVNAFKGLIAHDQQSHRPSLKRLSTFTRNAQSPSYNSHLPPHELVIVRNLFLKILLQETTSPALLVASFTHSSVKPSICNVKKSLVSERGQILHGRPLVFCTLHSEYFDWEK